MQFQMARPEQVRRAEWAVCLGATLAAIGLHVFYLTHAGGLWRDETNSIHIATSATAGEVWRLQAYSSFPVLFDTLVRCWWAIGLGGSELGFRCLGFLVAVALLGAVWLAARVLRSSLPLLSLGLVATNLTVVRWGDSLRAYGLGSVLILLTLAMVWSLMRAPSIGRFIAATLAAVLSVQCLYQNAFLLFAICLAGCFVCFRRRQDRKALILVAVGAVAALSLLPYLSPALVSQRWWVVEQTGFKAAAAWSSLSDALGSPMAWTIPVWIGLGLAAAGRGVLLLFLLEARGWQRRGGEDVRLFAAITLALAALLFLTFVAISRLPTQPWYWLPLMVTAAVCIDAALGSWLDRYRGWRLGLVALMTFAPLITGVSLARYRQTNIDLIAAWLREQAKPNDLILVYPWFFGVTFNRYYTGATPWTTLPALADLRVHRYDLLKEKLAATAPIKSVLDQIAQTLASGNRLWIVGELPGPEPGETAPPDLPPAPESPYGWSDVPYSYVWGRQTEHFIVAHGGRTEVVPIGSGDHVSLYEKSSLAVVKGWALTSEPVR
jgi:hypothetical protein